ncbi:hypothetical protein CLF_101344 [Clonorchis sinensis]|uniref:Uncharacterized protein n=1 Tax=Clonorchis sinensis TaxID=79923 RepID=G7Y5J3_CLOSI|nr:hypothetical protein CLF_101344 [Clonorchis sinensis]
MSAKRRQDIRLYGSEPSVVDIVVVLFMMTIFLGSGRKFQSVIHMTAEYHHRIINVHMAPALSPLGQAEQRVCLTFRRSRLYREVHELMHWAKRFGQILGLYYSVRNSKADSFDEKTLIKYQCHFKGAGHPQLARSGRAPISQSQLADFVRCLRVQCGVNVKDGLTSVRFIGTTVNRLKYTQRIRTCRHREPIRVVFLYRFGMPVDWQRNAYYQALSFRLTTAVFNALSMDEPDCIQFQSQLTDHLTASADERF